MFIVTTKFQLSDQSINCIIFLFADFYNKLVKSKKGVSSLQQIGAHFASTKYFGL